MMTPLPVTPERKQKDQGTGTPGTPLTHAQESLYFLQQLTKGQSVYNMPQAFRLRGKLDLDALTNAVRWLVERHHALRTIIKEGTGGPIQTVQGDGAELGCLRVQEVASEKLLREELGIAVSEPFDLENGPIFRVDLFRLSPVEHVLLLNLHHLVGDMSSLGIIFQDLSVAYAAYAAGRSPEAAGAVRQVSEFASRSRSKPVSPETIRFWKANLQGNTADLDLTVDRFRPKYPSFKGAVYYFDLPDGLPSALQELARKNRSSLYMVSLAALQALLFRYTGQEKFAL